MTQSHHGHSLITTNIYYTQKKIARTALAKFFKNLAGLAK
jgi:hypothetical protein